MMERKRCFWADRADEPYKQYHDIEWGVPVHDDRLHFELLTLEGAQAGLNWAIVLKKREAYRKAFFQFHPQKVALITPTEVNLLLQNEELVRHRLKIESTVSNAQKFCELQDEFGSYDSYVWQFVGGKPIINEWHHQGQVPCESQESKLLARDMKKRGFRFVGPTTLYAYMQAAGLVNDHTLDCFCHPLNMK